MIKNVDYWIEIQEYAHTLASLVSSGELTDAELQQDPLYRCIGFQESVDYVNDIQ
jgi:hypothetical protein